ncbi:hypothetical protein ZEAMMB73_Zm00001d012989 [Zea mays]|uniref:Uncharacterized protein n=1 Tax=Zea mays TaxID=4577 RepID=A0A1D6GEQ0_MAIZE|nr:hypothetical protein ZEAMMB73_Zm00001d012989 [Zea mays]
MRTSKPTPAIWIWSSQKGLTPEGLSPEVLAQAYFLWWAPSLKSLHLCLCHYVTNQGFAEAVNCFPQLEELDITFCSLYGIVCETAGRACPTTSSSSSAGAGKDVYPLKCYAA